MDAVKGEIEEIIVDNIHILVEKSEQINSYFLEFNIYTTDGSIIKNKINKIENIIRMSELEYEYQDNKEFIIEKINRILDDEDTILQIIKEKGADSTEIASKLKTIRSNIEQLEAKLFQISDYFILNGTQNDIRNHIRTYKQQLTLATQEIEK